MSIEECKTATVSMPVGTKFRQSCFSEGEFIWRDEKGHLRDEDNTCLIENEFWALRWSNPMMRDGWETI